MGADAWPVAVIEWLKEASSSREAFSRRIDVLDACVNRGLQVRGADVSPEVADAMVDSMRSEVGFPVRPAVLGSPWSCIMRDPLKEDAVPTGSGFAWRYLTLPVPWLEPGQSQIASFPMSVAWLWKPWEGESFFLSLHSLFHVLPMKTEAWQFVGAGAEDDVAPLLERFGAAKFLIRSNKSVGQRRARDK